MAEYKYNNYKNERDRYLSFGNYTKSDLFPTQMSASGLFYDNLKDLIICSSCGIEKSQWCITDNPYKTTHSSPCHFAAVKGPSLVKEACESNQMFSEIERLKSFELWPKKNILDINQLAASGLYFIGKDDITQCPFCNGKMTGWMEGDIPQIEHAKHFSKCTFVKGIETKNIPINTNDSSDSLCNVCFERKIDIVNITCGHLANCSVCARKLDKCIICRKNIIYKQKIYFT